MYRPAICENCSIFCKSSTSLEKIAFKPKARKASLAGQSFALRFFQDFPNFQKIPGWFLKSIESHPNSSGHCPSINSESKWISSKVFLFVLPNHFMDMSLKYHCSTRQHKRKPPKMEVTFSTLEYNNLKADRDASKRF